MRMHEILGVEPGEVFVYNSIYCNEVKYNLDAQGNMYRAVENHKRVPSPREIVDIINHPERIIRKPRLTDGQIEALMILHTHFGAKWLATDGPEDDRFVEAFFDKEKPGMNKGFWFGENWFHISFQAPIRKEIEPLLNPNEPLDIVQTLKDAGVEV